MQKKKKKRKKKENVKNKKNWNSNKHNKWNKKYIYNNELNWSFFRSERALPGSKYPSVHIIELACMIQVFRLICFWAKTKWTYVQREKRNLYSTGKTPLCWISCEKESYECLCVFFLLHYFFFFSIFFCLIIDKSLLTLLPARLIGGWFTWSPHPL